MDLILSQFGIYTVKLLNYLDFDNWDIVNGLLKEMREIEHNRQECQKHAVAKIH